MKNVLINLTQNIKNRIPKVVLRNRPQFVIGTAILALLLVIPLLTVQKLNEPFEKLSFKLNKPPAVAEIPKESSGESTRSTTTGKVHYPHDYTIVLLGDSMTERLGNTDELRGYLSEYYPDKTFEVLNYGYGATNITSVKERLLEQTDHFRDYQPITNIEYDLILIESFANNPLSEYTLEEGLAIQRKTLDETIALVKQYNPNAKIAFLATIAPNKDTYAKSSRDLSEDVRKEWVEERIQYFENHIKYASDNNIPLINIYKDSQDLFGNGKMIYIDDKDFIHPSPLGIIFISQKIAEGIHDLKLLPE